MRALSITSAEEIGDKQVEIWTGKAKSGLSGYNKIALLQFSVYFLLCSLIAGIGSATFLYIRNTEYAALSTQFAASCLLIQQEIFDDVKKKGFAAEVANNVFANADNLGYGGTFPNMTLPGYESIIVSLSQLASLRFAHICPLVTNVTRAGWEKYAADNVALLKGPVSLTVPTATNPWVVASGIVNRTSSGKVRASGYVAGSLYPKILFPIWQTAPIKSGANFVMVDVHSLGGARTRAIDIVLSTKKKTYTDLVIFARDTNAIRPSTLLYSPIISMKGDSEIIAMFSGAFTWDIMLAGISNEALYIVLVSPTHVFTYSLKDGQVITLGEGKRKFIIDIINYFQQFVTFSQFLHDIIWHQLSDYFLIISQIYCFLRIEAVR